MKFNCLWILVLGVLSLTACKKEQQETFFVKDPHGNILELKTLKN